MAEPCHTCKHYNDGHGDENCLFCDPDFEDRWEPQDLISDPKDDIVDP